MTSQRRILRLRVRLLEVDPVIWRRIEIRADTTFWGPSRCPPERVQAVADPRHPEHEEYRSWIGGSFDPEHFDSAKVSFESPARRLREVYDVV